MSSELAIRCEGVGKAFQLYAHQNDQLKQILFGLIKKFYKDKWVLHDVSFTVAKGERVGIVGRNGAGKTTLLQILCGITQPTKGDFEVKGRIAPILALGSGFDGLLTGRENARIGAAILGLSRKEVDACIEDIAAFADIGPFFEQPMRIYSMGMIARVAFAICAHAKADVLIVDEALSVGDEIFQKKCEKYIGEFARHGTILIVSHGLDFLQTLCTRVLWLEDGVVRDIGDPKRVITHYRAAMKAEQTQGIAQRWYQNIAQRWYQNIARRR
ncbi:ABC transporter ATP-binding protein [Methylocystis sp.]|jgi:lipopolysaccharide transport system ATP-binding protein|uniref:ABC transporter ATP-binding protein n=1 Tax=Methylocystis sp. TaxID=1911079 RepID=UPI003D0F7AD6